jgi:DNA-binding NarL/FixJ family response regulator
VALTILLVDDDPMMHRMLVPRLEELTAPPVARVLTALTPDAALAEVKAAREGPLVVVTDFNLKAMMNGLELLSRIREARPDAVRVLFSGYSVEQLGHVATSADVDLFLEKPLLLDDLVRPLAEFLTKRLG